MSYQKPLGKRNCHPTTISFALYKFGLLKYPGYPAGTLSISNVAKYDKGAPSYVPPL